LYCSQCGKKVKENMLFCPFCGSPIVIPEQDDAPQPSIAVSKTAKEPEPAAQPEKDVQKTEPEAFVPLDLESKWLEAETVKTPESVRETVNAAQEEPVRLQGRKPDLSTAASHGAPNISSRNAASTRVPPLRFDPNNMFLDEEDEEPEDDEEFEYEYEEPEYGSFFVRHIRGFVTLILFAVVAVVVLGWALSSSGQLALARADLAWKPGVYAEIAYESYLNGSYITAGDYYAKAYERDKANYDYANSAAVSYYMANDTIRAESMARSAINVNPNRAEAYELILRLYPNSAERPQNITKLIETGYHLTGNESLNIQ